MSKTTTYAADIAAVREAAERIAHHARHTPVVTFERLDALAGRSLFFKCELYQKTGSFKFRGACNAVMKLTDQEADNGVVTHSSGNHAQALALAAKRRAIPAHIVMPETASAIKRKGVEDYDAEIYLCEPGARETTAAEVQARTGAVLIPPYDHPDIIAGQGTAALEMLDQVPDLDAIITPVGGGGLLAGTCITVKTLRPEIRVFAAEPAGADDAARSIAKGEIVPQTGPNTCCDGLLTSLGELTWPIIRDHVERVITIPDDVIIATMRMAWQRAKLLVETNAAVAIAVALSDEFKSLDGLNRVGVVLSGGNVDIAHLPW